MTTFILKRFAALAITLLVTALIIFIVLEILPGDPASVILGLNATPESVAALRADLGLDKPVVVRFFLWIYGLMTGDLGTSYSYRVTVASLIWQRLQVSLPLTILAMAISTAIGIPAGLFAASRAGKLRDIVVMMLAEAGLSIPNFWFGILFVLPGRSR